MTHPNDRDDAGNDNEDLEKDPEAERQSSEFARMLEASFAKPTKKLKVGDKLRGEILIIGKEEVYVSTGTMNDGAMPRRELLDEAGNLTHKVGDVIDVYVTNVRGSDVSVSTNPTSINIANDLEDAHDMMLAIEGRVAEVVNGGFRVSIKGKLAFCPISQMDIARIEKPEEYVGKKFEFRITRFEEGGRNIVVSRRTLLEEQRELSAGSFLTEHHVGDIVQGKVMRLEKFGAFVELAPGIDGLLHVSELSWSRVNDPAEVVKPGQDVTVKILKMETVDGRLRISLSAKQAGSQPWENVPRDIVPGNVVEGRVTRCMKFGAFVELAPGLEGLIPMSEMSYTKRVLRAEDVVKEGERVTVMIKEMSPETRRISLSLRDAGQDPWALVAQKYPVGAIVTGKIERREAYGLFVNLEPGITGLLPKSKANETPDFPFEKLKVGDTVQVQVGELRLEERRMSLTPPGDASVGDWKAHVAAGGAGTSGGSFGTLADKLSAALSKKKPAK